MPIYAYRCGSCGFEKDHLQKLSDAALHICPQCGQATYTKQLTAAGFQLKGSGWYATDFKGGRSPASTEITEGNEKPNETSTKTSQEKGPACVTGATACADH
ncbi:MAG: zinc ribbon domain-containing protein [Candidatus Accumulibacter cognatus]|uniref:Zinc ribbon domain-containing protein n=1 Tax=Candidatus Accumulibacter cognatus TaxID=2954383 RepID=A0A7D5NBG7_9PROT|nr:MAG: zinc ribbon domain-containing protein [Candidatus Accumulibacter cognatus]